MLILVSQSTNAVSLVLSSENAQCFYTSVIYCTFKKLRLVCQSTIQNGYRWSSLSLGEWQPARRYLAPAKRTPVSWSPKHGTLTPRKGSFQKQ